MQFKYRITSGMITTLGMTECTGAMHLEDPRYMHQK